MKFSQPVSLFLYFLLNFKRKDEKTVFNKKNRILKPVTKLVSKLELVQTFFDKNYNENHFSIFLSFL